MRITPSLPMPHGQSHLGPPEPGSSLAALPVALRALELLKVLVLGRRQCRGPLQSWEECAGLQSQQSRGVQGV